MKNQKIFLLVCIALVTTSCYSISVRHDYDTDTDFSSLKTFDWMKDPITAISSAREAIVKSTLLDRRVKEAVNSQLAVKGLKQDAADPDFLIVYYISVEDKLKDYGSRYDRVREYREGTLILDFVDRDTMEIIWRGIAQRTLDPNPTPEKMKKNVDEAVEKLFDNFPPSNP